MIGKQANDNRAPRRPLCQTQPQPRLIQTERQPRPALSADTLQLLAEIQAKAVEIRLTLGLPPDAAIPAGPLTDILLQSRTR